jgi:serine/threonine protein kinase
MPDESGPSGTGGGASESASAGADAGASSARRFGDYELLEQIGRGGMGVVYKARQVALNRLVALKMISAGEFAAPVLIRRFHREAEATANLQHPQIVPIYEIGERQGQHFYSMRLVDGAGLDTFITRSGFCFDKKAGSVDGSTRGRLNQVAGIMVKVARAVDYAHQHGVLHRDLKPGNILLDRTGEPHLTDFGVAKMIGVESENLTASGAILGTPTFMAPEQATGQSKLTTTAADVYSLGAILYTMLTGSPPFRGDTPVETLRKVVEEEAKHPSTLIEGMDVDLATIAMKCLEKEPGRRYASAAALADDLERWLKREPIQARPSGTLGRAYRWCRREPVLASLTGGLAVCLVLISILSLVAFKREQKRGEVKIEEKTKEVSELKRAMLNKLDQFWTNAQLPSLTIESSDLARLTDRAVKETGTLITFGINTHTMPSDMFGRVAPFLSYLETNRLDPSLRVNFMIFHGYSNAMDALIEGKVDFMRPGPAAYVNARLRDRNLQLLGKQLHDGVPVIQGAIFVMKNSGIANLSQVVGKTMASSDEESTFGNFVPKALLIDLGINIHKLHSWTFIGAHDATIREVVAGKYQVGAANLNYVMKSIREGNKIEILQMMHSISFPWVARSGLDETIVGGLRQALLSIKDKEILQLLDSNLTGFAPAQPAEYDDFEREIIPKTRKFDE